MAFEDREFGQPPLSRDELLDAPLLQLHGCSLSMRCYEGCTKPGSLSLQQMAASYGRGLQLKRALARLRCKGCRRSPAGVTICDHPTPNALPTWRVVLVP